MTSHRCGEEGGATIWSGIRFNEEKNNQDKTELFILNSHKNMHSRFPCGYTEVQK